MSNTMHGPFTPGAATSTGPYGTGTGQSNSYTSGNANNAATQSATALHSFNPDLITAGFVLSGVTCAKDGTVANQLDIASGVAYLVVSDGTLARCDVAADNTHTTSGHPSTTMYLDLNPDGSWSWGTTHSAVANHLTICSVTTDGSANITTVTDARPRSVVLLGGMAPNGAAVIALQTLGLLAPDLGASVSAQIGHLDNTNGAFSNAVFFNTPTTGANPQGFYFAAWNGSATKIPLSLGGSFGGAASYFDANGLLNAAGIASVAGQATAGSFGAPVIVAQTVDQHITATTATTLLTFTAPAAGLYRASLYVLAGGANPSTLTAKAVFSDRNGALQTQFFTIQSPTAGGTNPVSLNAASIGMGNCLAAFPIMGYVKSGGTCQIIYQNATATPNDYASAMIERLS